MRMSMTGYPNYMVLVNISWLHLFDNILKFQAI